MTERIMSDGRKKPSVAFWASVAVVVVLIGYPLSIGPAVWLTGRKYAKESTVTSFYWPVLWSAGQTPPLENALVWWGSLGLPEGKVVNLMIETDEALSVFQFGAPSENAPDPDAML
jgi:hypothetical protein